MAFTEPESASASGLSTVVRDRTTRQGAVLTLAASIAAGALVLTHYDAQPLPSLTDGPLAGAAVSGGIDPNLATAAELTALPGIGPAKARAIIEYRESFRVAQSEEGFGSSGGESDVRAGVDEYGGRDRGAAFTKPEDLDAVRGIGPKTVETLRPWLRFD